MEREMDLKQLQEAILQQRLQKRMKERAAAEGIPVADRSNALPLSFAQQRLWFVGQLDSDAGAAYNMAAGLRLVGRLDKARLRTALDHVVARHEILRTTFSAQPSQVIAAPDAGFSLTDQDVGDAADIARISREEANRPFDLATGPLIRGQLLRVADEEHILLITKHHIISDGWSTAILIRELSALYRGDTLPPLPIQYADYAAWQRARLQGDVLQSHTSYWKQALAGAPELLSLPLDRQRPAVQSYDGGMLTFALPAHLASGLRALSQKHGATLFMTVLAGWSALLSRMSGQADLVIGTPVANRSRAEVEALIGFFVNTLALRVSVDDDATVAGLLAQVKASTLKAYEHAELPFEQVVEALQPVRSMSYSPLVQVMLSLNNTPGAGALQLPGLAIEPIEQAHTSAQFELGLSLADTGEGITGELRYATALFNRDTVSGIVARFERMLAAMVADDAQAVSRIDLLDAGERRQLLATFNATSLPYPQDALIHLLFEAQVAARPDAIALRCDGESVSFARLNRLANGIAHHLLNLGLRADECVGLCAQRSVELVAGMLGILKAGGAYVPLDADYPAERLAFMLEDSEPVAVLAHSALAAKLPPLSMPLVLLDAPIEETDHNPGVALHSGHMAYVIYTSGSTGNPKGVMVEHRNVIQLVVNEPCVQIDAGARLAFCANPAFDASTWEVWGGLLNGATLVVVPHAVLLDANDFGSLLEREEVSILHLTVGLFNQYASPLAHIFRKLDCLLFGGDQPSLATVVRVMQQSAPRRMLHCYGPTETTTFAVTHAIPTTIADSLPIGRPIANTQVYVLDRHMQPVPLGVAGEMYIGGAGVARGYLKRDDLTAERFLPDPFRPGARMYRTGDLGRWLADGTLEFLGRNDFQVKIRGFRVELGEIESRLAACKGVREAVVLAREDIPGDKRLVAYLIGSGLSAAGLRTELSASLADYMIPSAFVTLDAYPLTPNGKLDRRALPAPDGSSVAAREYVAPQGMVEETIAAIWQKLLGIERAGRLDHFFELGGHSLMAVQLVSHVREKLGVEMGLRELFAQPTLAAFAQAAAAARRSDMGAIALADRSAALPLSFAQQRLWFVCQMDNRAGAAYHMPAALRLKGTLDPAVLQAALDRIVARHESLRTTFIDATQVIGAADCGFHLVRRDAQESDLARLASEEAGQPFDLATGPLIRGQLLCVGHDDHVLLLTQHHIISDGWSSAVLVRELSALYAAFAQGAPDPLPALPVQYADYAQWQRQWLQGDVLTRQAEFWKAHLGGAPELLELPTDRPRAALQSYAGSVLPVAIPVQLSAGLRALGKRHGATLFMTMLAAWSALLSRMSGQDDIVIGTPVANRQRAEIESLIGFFVNTLALRVRLDQDPTVASLLAQVKASTLQAYDHADLPFEQVVDALRPSRSMSHSPLFQVMLSMNNMPGDGALNLPGLELSAMEQRHSVTQFDMILSLADGGDGITGTLRYCSDLFDRATMERLMGHFQLVLAAMVDNDTQRISTVELLDKAQRQQLLSGFNDTETAFAHDYLMHQLFEARADARPDAIALSFGADSLSYAGLNRRANRLAHELIAMGVRPDDRVAICMERGIDMVVGMLAILKAGGGYVPLDPGYPADRLAYVLGDCAPRALLASSTAILPPVDVPTLLIDGAHGAVDTNPVVPGLSSRHLAYVIYTSGSTGMPKGVMIEHANVARLFGATDHWFGFGPRDVWTLFHSFAFDFSVWELWGALAYGGRLVVVPYATSRSPADFYALLSREGVTVLNQTPGAFRQLIAAQADSTAAHALRTVIFGGEALDVASLRPWYQDPRNSAPLLVNMYGITETTVHVSYREISPADCEKPGSSPIGRQIPDLQIHILNPLGQLVPIGVNGEMFVGGAGVARAYLNRPELTAERFIADPFNPGRRLYRTGDVGRRLADGSIEYVGRIDFQVKIRGFRIELGEIEAALANCAGVREAVVIVRDERLVAYFTQTDEGAGSLREQLLQTLPDYMVPAAYVCLDALPLTANGKLDRKALPAPDGDAFTSNDYVAPQGDTETTLAQVWAEVLGLERVGANDNFFDIGGDSIRSIAIVAKARARGVSLAIVDIFKHPTVAALAASVRDAVHADEPVLAVLSAADRALLPQDVEDSYPVTMLQMGMIFHNEMAQGSGLYHDVFSHCLALPAWNADAMRVVLDALARKHPVLRTSFDLRHYSEPLQLVRADARIPMTVLDLSALDTAQQDQAVGDFIEAERKTSFDLESAPLMRIFIHVRGPKLVQYTLSFHHAILDGWSVASFQTELFNEYFNLLDSGAAHLALAPLSLSPKSTASRERQALASQADQEFWRAYLGEHVFSGLPPADGPIAADMDRNRGVPIDASVTAGLLALAAKLSVPMRTVLLAAHMRVVAILAGKNEVTTGMISNVRPEETDGDKVLGLFLNTLPFRQNLARATWADLVRQTYANELDVLAHRHYPYFQLHVDNGRNPFYEITFNYTNFHVYESLKAAPVAQGFNKAFEATGYGLDVNFNYKPATGIQLDLNTSCLTVAQTERILDYFQAVMAAMAADPLAFHDECSFLSEREHRQLLVEFNDNVQDLPPQALVHQLFEAQAASHPDATALVADGQTLSYSQLNRLANQVAHYLIGLGVQPDQRVAICVSRSADMVVGMLAVLKAGAAYVPLDPAYPVERLAYMLDDSAPVVLLTQDALAARLPAQTVPVLSLDSQAWMVATQADHNPDPLALGLNERHMAYVIYTSGSTGLPKGVMVEHANVVSLIVGHSATTGLTSADRVLQFASFSFDVSVGEVFPALSVGAMLVLRPSHMVVPDHAFLDFLEQHQVTVCDLPTAFWHQWAQDAALKQRTLGALRLVIVGGEKAEAWHLAAWMAAPGLGECRWLNAYGPTEATVTATAIGYDRDSTLPAHAIPIGRAIPNTRIYILDNRLQPIPLGVTGEIWIGGAGVARGYLDRPELTAERFVTDPFSATAAARMYRTGDLGRWMADGTIDYLGRNDFQVKIRGFRIELGEIESRLALCAGVREAIVVAREDQPGDKRLVAYVIAQEHAQLSAAGLRAQLANGLAEYMVPGAFVLMDAFPLTPNGKIDQKALPAPDGSAVVAREYSAPQGPVEEAIAAVWRELLGLAQVGRDDHFFELGGHSLMVVRLIERMRDAGLSLDVSTVFSAPTLVAMAAAVDGRQSAGTGFVAPPNLIAHDCSAITPDMLPLATLNQEDIDRITATVAQGAAGIQDIYPLGPLQEGILFHHMLDAVNDAYRLRSAIVFDSRARLDSFLVALQQIVDRHDILRTTIRWAGLAQPLQVVLRHVQLPVTELTLAPGGSAEEQFLALTAPLAMRLSLDESPLMSAYVAADPQSGEWLLSLLHHHIVCDHVTVELMMLELQVLLHQGADHLPPALPYRNFIAQTLASPQSEHEDYFRRTLGDVTEPTAAFGILDVQGDGGRLDETHLPLGEQLSVSIRDRARRLGVTPAVLFHVAMARMLAQTSGRDDVVFGTVMSGRLQGSEGAAQVLGMFINTLPIRASLAGRSVRDSVSDTYEALHELLAHEQASLATAQRCSGVSAPMPLFTSLFNYRHSHDDAATDGWEGIRSIADDERSNYPITVNVDDFGRRFGVTTQCTHGISARRVAAYIATAVESLVHALDADPATAVNSLDILPAAEREQLLGEFNAGAQFKQDQLMHQLFEAQAAARPDAVALTYEDSSVTYADLNRRANRLAHQLIAMGVRPDDRVAICVERGIEMVVGLLAILKAGGGYVPLDPGYPADRLAYVLGDSAPAALLTYGGAKLPPVDVPTLLIDAAHGGADTNPVVAGLGSRHLAYVIYTSGSTGMPKGVMIEHANVARLFGATGHWFSFGQQDVWTLFHSFAFDFSVWELWGALANGGRLVLVPYATSRSPADFYALLAREGVTVLNQTPSAFRQLIAAQAASVEQHTLRTVIFGGEALDVVVLRPWYQDARNASTLLVNMYGITETTVHVSYREISPADCEKPGSSPIGRQIPDLQIHILDPQGQLVPIGASGEMYVGGAGVARAYLNRPELTAERFIADPFNPGKRLYRTGDVGRRLADGSIDYIGRIDFQVKIRGFRIELGEIEAALANCAGVRDAVVIAREERLVAYFTQTEEGASADVLRAHLLRQLPDYMVPAAYVQLSELPLTANGKLDRKALPAPDSKAFAANEYVAPQGDTEIALAQVWSEVLGLERVGANDNFFDIGGDSIRSIAIVAKARERNISLAIVDIFKHPTVAALANAVSLRVDVVVADTASAIGAEDHARLPSHVEDAYPVTLLQMGMIFHNEMAQGTGLYHDVFSNYLALPAWQPETLRLVLDALAHKHPVLRTAFDLHRYNEPLQLVHRQAQVPMQVFDISDLDAAAQDKAVGAFVDAERKTSFSLDDAPLLRIFIHVRSPKAIQYTLSFHHAILDGWSVASFQTELFNAYFSLLESGATALDLAPLALTPRTTATAERRALGCPQHRSFWNAYLSDHVFTALPPADGEVAPDMDRTRGIHIDTGVSTRLQALAATLSVPIRTVLLTAHMRVLAMLAGKDDVTTGLVSNVRPEEADGEKVLGLFLNTLPFRQRQHRARWIDMVRDTYANELEVFAHRHYPYFQLHVDNGRNPLYEIAFNYTNFHVYDGLKAAPQEQGYQQVFESTGHGLGVNISYSPTSGIDLELNPGTLSVSQTDRILSYYEAVLAAMAADPQAYHDECDFLPAVERRQMLVDFNATAQDFGVPHQLIHQLFEEQAALRPDATALVFGEQSLTYAALNARANELAHRLIGLGVKADQRVAICVERSIDMIVGLLGILKAGGAYVPLDPAYPAERLAFMLDDAAPVALLTQKALAGMLSAPVMVILDEEAAPQAQSNPLVTLSRTNLAYVIYTSGSTGQPKGVMNQHDGLVNLACAQIEQFGVRQDSRVLQFVSFSFDVCISEITMALCSGAGLYLASAADLLPGEPLLATMERHAITHVSLPMAVLAALPPDAQLGRLQTLVVGGEALPPALANHWGARYALFNSYGPTEATVCASNYRCQPGEAGAVPIGRPLANTQIYILDSHLKPVPLGVAGEIHIGGAGVARGYLNRDALTAERFIADPFNPGARLYKTGDLGRWLADGNVEFMGRSDFQVKIRGFRIELGEIESRLLACEGVREAIVLAREDQPGDKRLVAYLTGCTQPAATLRAELGASLAEHMIPSAFVMLDAFPLTPNGKLDRKALPVPNTVRSDVAYVAPRDANEELLATVWAEALRLDRVGIHDNFFELGGNSLLIVKLHNRLLEHFPGKVAIADYFKHTTVARLAAHIGAGSAASTRLPGSISRAETRKSRLAVQKNSRAQRSN